MPSYELDRARSLISEAERTDVNEGTEQLGLDEYMHNLIASNVCSTIHIQYVIGEGVQVVATYDSGVKVETFDGYMEDEYKEFCKRTLSIDIDEKENCSRSLNIEGVMTRVFAIMPPYSLFPSVTISTTKQPPAKLQQQIASDDLLNEIVHDNFIIVGGSGSGKTYLLNYMLHKFIGKQEKIGIVEEFSELIPPNDVTMKFIVPPPKSTEKSKLRHITEQSNLMRLDAIYVGEIKGAEAWPFVVNMASGTRGACTMHGDSAEHALSRLRALCQMEMPNVDVVNDFIAKSLRYIIVMNHHKIVCIKRLEGTAIKGNFAMKDIVGGDVSSGVMRRFGTDSLQMEPQHQTPNLKIGR